MKRFFCFFYLVAITFFSSVQASDERKVALALNAADDWQLLQKRWHQSDYLSSRFIQSRHLAVLSRPLVSEGDFYYRHKKGICWSMKKPWEQWFVVTPESILQGEGESSEALGQGQPMFSVFSKAFFALFTGDIFVMEKWFDMSLTINEKAWEITLHPTDEAVAILANKMVLKGDSYLQEVTLFDANDDKTEIKFLNVSDIAKPLSDDEKHCYQ